MIDFHCHLDLYPDPHAIARRCAGDGLYVLSVTTTPSAWRGTSALERGRIRTALGLHPQLAQERITELELFDELVTNTLYVGEIGLDGSTTFRKFVKQQRHVFDHILTSCTRVGGRILSIHSRHAATPVLDSLAAHPESGTAILHWFSGTACELDRAIELGCWFSVGPAMLRSKKGRELVSRMPPKRVFCESDGPFAQIGNRPVYPWDLHKMIGDLSVLWGIPNDSVANIFLENLKVLTEHHVTVGSSEPW